MVKLWKAENFDAEGLMQLYADAVAKYSFAQAAHHDNFDNWDSAHNRFNSVAIGPQKDIVGLWQSAAQKFGLPFGVSEHLGAAFSWWSHNKNCGKTGPYDGNDPDYEGLYLPNHDEPGLGQKGENWYTSNPWWHDKWFDRIKDLIDKYHPDLLYSDGTVPFSEHGLGIIAHLYNTSAALNGGKNLAVYNHKDRSPLVYKVGVLDIERNVPNAAFAYPRQTDTCVGGWFYDVRRRYKTAQQVIDMLVDSVAKNENLLLNFTQKPDGTLDDGCLAILADLTPWIKINGEGIYATRPWHIGMKGEVNASQDRFKEDALEWTPQDYRFTCVGNAVYAFQMAWPDDGVALIKAFTSGRGYRMKIANVQAVELLGYAGDVSFEHNEQGLVIRGLPDERPVQCAHCFKITTGGASI